MDEYSSKRSGAGIMAPRKGYNVAFKDKTTGRDQNAQFCNRTGCSGRLKYGTQNTRIGSSDKAKCSKLSFSSSNENEMIGTSSRSRPVMAGAKDSYLDSKRKSPSRSESDSSESSQSGDSPSRSPRANSISRNKSVQVTSAEIGSSSVPSNSRSQKTFQPKYKDTLPVSSVSYSSSNGSRYGLKNLKCNSISDVVRPSCSSSEPKSARKNLMKTRSSEGESSLTRRVRQNGQVVASSASGEDSSRAASVRTRLSCRQNGRNSSSLREPPLRISSPDSEIRLGGPSSLHPFSANGPSSGSSSSSYSLSSSNDDSQSTMMPFTSADLGFTHFRNRDSFQRYNMDGIAEILLALERIEHDAELTHEQLLALETGLFLSGLNLYDQHRDMRLDIDNMSYEELLALEERMGTVSTALSEEDLLKCVRRSIYQSTRLEERVSGSGEDGDDIKCSICQEEYVVGDEIGKLVECEHDYHVACIHEWLLLKNWCPICKAAAFPTESSSS